MSKTIRTPKRLAADILRTDLTLVTDYWYERHIDLAENDSQADKISEALQAIVEPFLQRLDKIAKDVDCLE